MSLQREKAKPKSEKKSVLAANTLTNNNLSI